jgi:uncharacterized cupredoxin-like copper-binding protein
MIRRQPRLALILALALLTLSLSVAAAQSSVSVDLDEWSVTAQPGSVEAGSVSFEVSNEGSVAPHELVVIRSDLAPDALPVADSVVTVGELDVVHHTDLFPLGEGGSFSVDLTEGNYVLICNLEGHYELGMATAFSVTAAVQDEPAADEEEEAAPEEPAPVTEPAPAAAGSAGIVGTGSNWTLTALVTFALTLLAVAAGRGMTGFRRSTNR